MIARLLHWFKSQKTPKQLWIDALRSGKYEQCYGSVRSRGGRCCAAGVAYDLYLKSDQCKIVYDANQNLYVNSTNPLSSDLCVLEWLGIENWSYKLPDGSVGNILHDNDSRQLSFYQIADRIETATFLSDEDVERLYRA